MRLPTVCLGVRALTGILAAPQNDEKGLRWFRIVLLHLLQQQKCGVWPVLLTPPSCIMVFHREYFQYSRL